MQRKDREMLPTRTVAALVLGCLAVSAVITPAWALRYIYRSTQAISHELGSKKAVGYFLSHNGACQLTLMVAEAVDVDVAPPSSAAKLSVSILPGQSASLSSEEGQSMLMTCGADAQTLTVNRAPAKASPQGTAAAQSDRVVR